MSDDQAPKISKGILKAADRYMKRMRQGERIMRDANGRVQWASGKPVGAKTVRYMLDQGQAVEMDTDLFGDRSRGQTIGLAA